MVDNMMFHMTKLTQFVWIWDKLQNWKGYFDGRLSTACIPFQGVIVLNRRWVFRHYIIAVIVCPTGSDVNRLEKPVEVADSMRRE